MLLRFLITVILVLHIFIGHLPNLGFALMKSEKTYLKFSQIENNQTCEMACCSNKADVGGCSCCKKEENSLVDLSYLPILSTVVEIDKQVVKTYTKFSGKENNFTKQFINELCSCSEASSNGLVTFLDLPEKNINLVVPKVLILIEQVYFDYSLTNKPTFLYLRSPPLFLLS